MSDSTPPTALPIVDAEDYEPLIDRANVCLWCQREICLCTPFREARSARAMSEEPINP